MNLESGRKTPLTDTRAIVLVGGKGTRLAEITESKLSKGLITIDNKHTVTGIEYISHLLQDTGIKEVYLCAKDYAEQYIKIAENNSYALITQRGDTGTNGAIKEVFDEFGEENPYLVISVDTFLSRRDLIKLLTNHKKGTISWGIAPYQYDSMSSYYGLIADNSTHAILGDIRQNWWKNWNLSNTSLYIKGAAHIIEPLIYIKALETFKRFCKKSPPIDMYWDVFPLLEEVNRRRIMRGKDSILQGIIFDDALIDYGTPERLNLVRNLFAQVNDNQHEQ